MSGPLNSQTESAPLPLVLMQRLLAIGILAIVIATLLDFPVAVNWVATGFTLYLLLLWRYPWLWLIVLPALLPVLDLTPASGRIFFGEFDLLVLLTIAAGLMRRESWFTPLQFGRKRWLLILLLLIWQSYTTLKGLLPLQPIDANAFTSYYSHYNSLRLAKGFLWALLLLPLLGQAINRGEPVVKLFIGGVIGGLLTDLLAILWERALFSGILNFSKPYRVTGLFSGMTTGGAPLDAHLIFSLPFVGALFLLWRQRLIHLAGFCLLLFALYGLAVTFSRADYAAVIAAILTGLTAWMLIGRQATTTQRGKGWYLLGIVAMALMIAIPFISGEFIKHRFSTVSSDLAGRFQHWHSAVNMMADDAESKLFGMGRGAFPRSYYWSHPGDDLPPTLLHARKENNSFLRMDRSNDSGDLFLTQRFQVAEPGPYRLSISLRPRSDQATRLLVEICERLIYQSYKTCRWMGINTGSDSSQWINFNKTFSVKNLGVKHWYGSRPVQISILNRGLTQGVDIDDVQIITPSGKQLLKNSTFDQGLDHWFFYSGNHLGWHVKNIWVDTFFEGGWIGLFIFTLLIISTLLISFKRLRHRDSFPLLYLPALTGLMVVGLFDSILDEPRLTLLLFLSTWLLLASRATALPLPSQEASAPGVANKWLGRFRSLPPVYQASTLVLSTLLLLALGILGTTHYTGMGTRQLALRVLDKLGQQDGYLVQAIMPDTYHSEHTLVGRVRQAHPRILLPALADWPGEGVPQPIAQRLALYSSYDRKHYRPCSSNSLPGLTACWLSTGQSATAEKIIRGLKSGYMQVARNNENYGNVWQYAFAYDFIRLYPGLKQADREQIEARIRGALRHALLLLEGNELSLWHGRSTLSAIAWLAAVVLDPANPDDLNLITQAQAHFLETLKAAALTEAWPEGYNYWINNRGFLLALATNAYLNGLESLPNREQVTETLRRIGYWQIYNTRPDNRAQGLGDEGPRVDLKDETRRVIDLITQATGDPALAAYSRYLGELYGYASYYQGYRWGFLLFNDPAINPLPQQTRKTLSFARDHLPGAALFGKNAMNMAYFRSGWLPQDTFISFRAGDSFTHHGHYDAGHFTLFKGAPLASNSGTYGGFFSDHRLNYTLRTVAKNSLLVMRPGEAVKPNRFFKENVAGGGQRITLPTGSAIRSTAQWAEQLNNGLHLEGGQLLAFDGNDSRYHYIAADLTPAYNNSQYDENGQAGKVAGVIRELLYLVDEDQLIIHDKVVTTDPGYPKKWLLHTINRPQLHDTKVLKGSLSNGILQSSARQLLIANGPGRLRVDSLYPRQAITRLIGGPDYRYYVETDGDDSELDGQNMVAGAHQKPWFDDARWRIEIQPAQPRLEDHFLTVLTPSLEDFRAINPERLDTGTDKLYGTRSQGNLVLFTDRQPTQSVSFMKKPGDKALYLLGVSPGTLVNMTFNGTETRHTTNNAGLVTIPFETSSTGRIRLSW